MLVALLRQHATARPTTDHASPATEVTAQHGTRQSSRRAETEGESNGQQG
ncbi:hypothetical protein KPATCC21470_3471 [Kitasatospora purpeofusca]